MGHDGNMDEIREFMGATKESLKNIEKNVDTGFKGVHKRIGEQVIICSNRFDKVESGTEDNKISLIKIMSISGAVSAIITILGLLIKWTSFFGH